jgi:polar amino acid transport system substrate-binding protein/glutamate/aspartate transport system substrate-binding protein
MSGIAKARAAGWIGALMAPALLLSGASASAGTMDRLKQEKTIRLGVRDDAPPFSYKNGDGAPAGFMVDLCRAVAAELAAQTLLEIKIEYVPVTAADRFEAIETGKADLLCEPTTETLTRRQHVDFSIPTFVDGASLITVGDGPRDFAALAGKKIGVLGGTTTEQELRSTLKATGMTADVVVYTSHELGLKGLVAGEVSAYFGDRSIIGHVASRSPDSDKFRLATAYLTIEPYALALSRGDNDFRLAVDMALSHIYRSGHIAQIFLATFGPNNPPTESVKMLFALSGLPD